MNERISLIVLAGFVFLGASPCSADYWCDLWNRSEVVAVGRVTVVEAKTIPPRSEFDDPHGDVVTSVTIELDDLLKSNTARTNFKFQLAGGPEISPIDGELYILRISETPDPMAFVRANDPDKEIKFLVFGDSSTPSNPLIPQLHEAYYLENNKICLLDHGCSFEQSRRTGQETSSSSSINNSASSSSDSQISSSTTSPSLGDVGPMSLAVATHQLNRLSTTFGELTIDVENSVPAPTALPVSQGAIELDYAALKSKLLACNAGTE